VQEFKYLLTFCCTGVNISDAIDAVLSEYGLSVPETPATTDHGSNIVAALKNGLRLDCLCHRLHTVLETAWKDTRRDNPDAAAYETAISELCRFAKQSTGIQEQLPKSLKHGGDTRPWVSMFRRAESVEASYDALVSVLTGKDRLDLIAGVNRAFNREVLEITKSVKEVFESLEKGNDVTLMLVVPSYYLLLQKLAPGIRESSTAQVFKEKLRHYLDAKFWSSIKAMHWMATFIDPSFKHLEFLPQSTADDARFRRNLMQDLDTWLMEELNTVTEILNGRSRPDEQAG